MTETRAALEDRIRRELNYADLGPRMRELLSDCLSEVVARSTLAPSADDALIAEIEYVLSTRIVDMKATYLHELFDRIRARLAAPVQPQPNDGLAPLRDAEQRRLNAQAAPVPAIAREPDGYLYEYPSPWGGTVLIQKADSYNGHKPIRAVPYWFSPDAAQPAPVGAKEPSEHMCPNCVTPWKCNGPHIGEAPPSGYDAPPAQGEPTL